MIVIHKLHILVIAQTSNYYLMKLANLASGFTLFRSNRISFIFQRY